MNNEDLNLAALMNKFTRSANDEAYEWARKEADKWPDGTYSHHDFVVMFQKGYLMGLLMKDQ